MLGPDDFNNYNDFSDYVFMSKEIIDLSKFEISTEYYNFIPNNKKKTYICGYIFTNDVKLLYNLDDTKTEWIINFCEMLFILKIINDDENIIQIIGAKSYSNKIFKFLQAKRINEIIMKGAVKKVTDSKIQILN
jgi:hypothetical protein